MKVPNLNILDQSCTWSKSHLADKKISVATTTLTLDWAEKAFEFAIKTFEEAGFHEVAGKISPRKTRAGPRVQVELVFAPNLILEMIH